jgi:hypothetical protein
LPYGFDNGRSACLAGHAVEMATASARGEIEWIVEREAV